MPVSVSSSKSGFTLVELLILVTIVGVFALIVLSVLGGADAKAKRITCVDNLKHLVVSLNVYHQDFKSELAACSANDQEQKFSFNLNQLPRLQAPRYLICPSDVRKPAATPQAITPANCSYFLSESADMDSPNGILAGDRNLALAGFSVENKEVRLDLKSDPAWTDDLHSQRGHLLRSDSSVNLFSSRELPAAVAQSGEVIIQVP